VFGASRNTPCPGPRSTVSRHKTRRIASLGGAGVSPTLGRHARSSFGAGVSVIRAEVSLIASSGRPGLGPRRGAVHLDAGGGTRTPDTRIMIPAYFGLTIGTSGPVGHAVGHNRAPDTSHSAWHVARVRKPSPVRVWQRVSRKAPRGGVSKFSSRGVCRDRPERTTQRTTLPRKRMGVSPFHRPSARRKGVQDGRAAASAARRRLLLSADLPELLELLRVVDWRCSRCRIAGPAGSSAW
jgi:hypothetical protein